ncbi:hypothetical protein NHX12_032085 [Muraenolepis orangiensis]|uniref:Uncharacterized protein n=1 Tax=Muraenolepis orangiensis TaxID=630683 RepID=A0A9Q0EAU9_9TELE|nr:hypothetical protein NHX12_032085 [Muraenolepis orangiensis]
MKGIGLHPNRNGYGVDIEKSDYAKRLCGAKEPDHGLQGVLEARLGKKAFRNDVVVVPRLKEALPRTILVFFPVMVEAPRDVVLLPVVREDPPMAILVFPLLMVVFPSERAVLPSVMLVFPITGEKVVAVQAVAVWTQVWWQRLGLTLHGASHTHAAIRALWFFFPPPAVEWRNGEWPAAGIGAECYGWVVAAPPLSHNALVEQRNVGCGRPHTTHVSP